MSQAIANADELEAFARDLEHFNAQLKDSMSRLQSRFNRLSDTWRDQEQQRFAQEFQATTRVLHQFIRVSEVHIPVLRKKATHLRNYFNQR